MDFSLPGSSVHGISQATILEWVAVSFSKGSSPPRGQTLLPWLAGRLFTTEPPGKPITLIQPYHIFRVSLHLGFPCGSPGKECLQCRRPEFDPWVGKIPWRKERLPTLVFWHGEFHESMGLQRVGHKWLHLDLIRGGPCSRTLSWGS